MSSDPCEPTKAQAGPAEAGWRDVPRDDGSPFIFRFETKRQKYVYDVNTRRILRVSPIVWEVLGDYGLLPARQIVSKWATRYPAGDLSAALEAIDKSRREQGVFLSVRPAQVTPPPEERIRRELESGREQVILNITEDCCFRCTYCVFGGAYPGERVHSERSMSWEIARSAIDDFLRHSHQADHRTVSFYGGEPLLSYDLLRRCAEHVRQARPLDDVRLSLTTNGALLAGEIAGFLAAEKFSIVVSLDGPEAVHDRHRRTKTGSATWRLVCRNLAAFLDAHPEYRTNGLLRFNAVATGETDLLEVEQFFGSCGLFTDSMALEIGQQRYVPGATPPGGSDALATSRDALYRQFLDHLRSGWVTENYARRCRWVEASFFDKPFIGFHKRGYLTPHLPQSMSLLNTCVPGGRKVFVTTDGNYLPCERVVPSDELVMGHAAAGMDVPRIVALLVRWAAAARDRCRYCWCLPTCKVGCFATLPDLTPEAMAKACAACRRQTHYLLTQYCAVLEENPRAFDFAEQTELV